MEKIDFEFIKNRDVGELIQDYLSLFKKIFRHFNRCIFKFILPFLAIFLVLFFFASSLGVDIFYSKDWRTSSVVIIMILVVMLVAIFYFTFIPTFGLEYMFLLKEKENTDFNGKEVWQRVKRHMGKYIVFFLASIVVMLILAIPLALAALIFTFIPIAGQIAFGIAMACVLLVFVCGLFLYLEDRETVFDSFLAAFRLLRKKLLAYGLTAYIFRLLVGISLLLITIIPSAILGVIAYNTIGFNEQILISFGGKIMISILGTLVILFSTISSIYTMTFYTLIYFSSLEATNKEGSIAQLDQIGLTHDEDN
ncbi:MAG TPA: hypothetical protein VFL76_09350 [Edaphocola sp.]|nr:hypothetical protein [Edaphocola sp.]